jgi:hypothetical protein
VLADVVAVPATVMALAPRMTAKSAKFDPLVIEEILLSPAWFVTVFCP